jgi:hypothetical protein
MIFLFFFLTNCQTKDQLICFKVELTFNKNDNEFEAIAIDFIGSFDEM